MNVNFDLKIDLIKFEPREVKLIFLLTSEIVHVFEFLTKMIENDIHPNEPACVILTLLDILFIVEEVEDGVCGFYANAYRHTDKVFCMHAPRPSKREGSLFLRSPPSCGFSGSPPSSPRMQLC